MLIAHLSDLHVSAGVPETAPVRRDAPGMARRMVAALMALPQAPDAVLVSGDLADGGSAEDYALVSEILAPLPMPLFVVPGNHDRRETMRAAFAPRLAFTPGPFLNVEATVAGAQIVGLDSTIPGRTEGELCPARLEWLRERLEGGHSDARPLFLMLHHPPFSSGNAHWDRSGLVEGAGRLRELLAGLHRPVRILCGHVHQAWHGIWAGHYAAVAGSPAFQYDFGFDGSAEPPLSDGPAAIWLHHRRADGSFAVHPRLVALPPRTDL